jgi:hypothetical protein
MLAALVFSCMGTLITPLPGVQADQPADNDAWTGATADNEQPRPPCKALHPGPHTWPQPPLLFHRHQLPVWCSGKLLLWELHLYGGDTGCSKSGLRSLSGWLCAFSQPESEVYMLQQLPSSVCMYPESGPTARTSWRS